MADDFLAEVTLLVDDELRRLLDTPAERVAGLGHRGVLTLIKTAVVAHRNGRSMWHHQPSALAAVPGWTAVLRSLQRADGLFTSGDNLASPPDSSFTVNDMAMVQQLLAPGDPTAPELGRSPRNLPRSSSASPPPSSWVVCTRRTIAGRSPPPSPGSTQ